MIRKIVNSVILGFIFANLSINSFASSLSNIENANTTNIIDNKNADSWVTNISSHITNRSQLASGVIGSKIYIIGGYTNTDSNAVDIYDTKTGTWSTGANMPTPRSALSVAVVGNKIYCIGGMRDGTDVGMVEIYDTTTDTWSTGTKMITSRSYLGAHAIGDKIYCIGGGNYLFGYNNVEIYDTKTNSWTIGSSKPTAVGGFASSVIGNKIYCIGGGDVFSISNSVEIYDTITNTWSIGTNMPTARSYLSSSVVGNNIYCFGGMVSYSAVNTVEIYNTKTNSWSTGTNIPTGRYGLTSSTIDNKIYVIGGNSNTTTNNLTIEAYVVNIAPEKATANLDLYITFENTLFVSIDTNQVTFNNFSGTENTEKKNALNISVGSSLPYSLNAYLETEIQNSDKSSTLDKEIFNIKESSEDSYKYFKNTKDKLILKDNNLPTNNKIHYIDLMLKGGLSYKTDIYKTTVKFEVEQK